MDDVPFDQLREEFQDQIQTLQRQLMQQVRVKEVRGNPLNGPMLSDLIEQYTNAINDGAVPNIQNAEMYIFKDQCQKALQNSVRHFEESFISQYNEHCPLSDEKLKELFDGIKEQTIHEFSEQCMGEDTFELEQHLVTSLNKIFSMTKEQNTKQSSQEIGDFLHHSFDEVRQKLMNNEFKEFKDYETVVRNY